jgi:TPR repeat protein
MFDDHWEPRVVDFGFARQITSPVVSSIKNDIQYTAPEAIGADPGATFDPDTQAKVDIFAYGMILYEIATGQACFTHPPGRPLTTFQVEQAIVDGKRPEWPPGAAISELIMGICEHCWSQNPDDRPEFYHVVLALREAGDPPFAGANRDEYDEYMNRVFEQTLQSLECESVFSEPPEPAAARGAEAIRAQADAGDALSQVKVGRLFAIGNGPWGHSLTEAFRYYQMAAAQNHPTGLYNAAVCLRKGRGCLVDEAESVRFIQRAAGLGSLEAARDLAELLRRGDGVPRDARRARELFKAGSDRGDMPCQFAYAQMLLEGEGGPRDQTAAAQLYLRAHTSGYDDASCDYAYMLLTGQIGPADVAKALDIYKQAATKGSAPAQLNLGILYHEGRLVPKDQVQAAYYFQMAAVQGLPRAEALWGMYLWKELGGQRKNELEARMLFRHAADAGDEIAQNNLGAMCEEGVGGPQHDDEALAHYRSAAQRGIGRAMVRFARLAHRTGDPDAINEGRQFLIQCRRQAPGTLDLAAAEAEYRH